MPAYRREATNVGGGSLLDCQAHARFVEELGYESIWQSEGRGGDQFSILTAVALATSLILLRTNISDQYFPACLYVPRR
jgi:alkanesulfonate monooxygenase SsuD/methylene tetrahydromethanopterin reductase-like flavin-dependent oxidoreductase (luciferase family)